MVPLQLEDNSFSEIQAGSEIFEVVLVKERSSGKLEIRSRLIPSPAPRRVMIRVQSSPSLPSPQAKLQESSREKTEESIPRPNGIAFVSFQRHPTVADINQQRQKFVSICHNWPRVADIVQLCQIVICISRVRKLWQTSTSTGRD